MPVTISDSLLAKELELDFFARIRESIENSLWKKISVSVQSTERSREYGWLGSAPAVNEFKAERRPAGLGEYTYVIKNKKWEASIEVDNDDLKHHRRGDQIQLRIAQLANRFAAHPNLYLFNTVLPAGETDNGYDGVSYFNASHPTAGSTQSNSVTNNVVALGAITTTEAESIFDTAWVQLLSMIDDQGLPSNENPETFVLGCSHLYVPVFRKLFDKNLVNMVGGSTISKAGVNVTVHGSPDIPNNKIYLFNGSDLVKPLVFQQVSEVEFGSEENFMTDFTVFGAKANYNFGYGDYKKAVLVTLS